MHMEAAAYYQGAPRPSTQVPRDAQELREHLMEEDRAYRTIVADGGVPTHDHDPASFDILTCPGSKADIIGYWSFDCPKAGRTILRRQLHHWRQFRNYQRCIRERFSRAEDFQRHIIDLKAYLRRHGVDDDLNLHNSSFRQNAYDDWKEFQFHELRQADALQDAMHERERELDRSEQEVLKLFATCRPRDECNRMMAIVEENRWNFWNAEREIDRHKVLTRWIGQQLAVVAARVPLSERNASQQAAEAAASSSSSSSRPSTIGSHSASSSRPETLPIFNNGKICFPIDGTVPYEQPELKYRAIEQPSIKMLEELIGRDGNGGTSWATSRNSSSKTSRRSAGNGKAPAGDVGSPSTVATTTSADSPAQTHAIAAGGYAQPTPSSPLGKRKTEASRDDSGRGGNATKRRRASERDTTTTLDGDIYGSRMHNSRTSDSSTVPAFPPPMSPSSASNDMPRIVPRLDGNSWESQQQQPARRLHSVASMLHPSPLEATSPGASSPGSGRLPPFSDSFANAHNARAHNAALPRLLTSDEELNATPSFHAINGGEQRQKQQEQYRLQDRDSQQQRHRHGQYSPPTYPRQQDHHDSQHQLPQQYHHASPHPYTEYIPSQQQQQQYMRESEPFGRPASSSSASTSFNKLSKYPNIMNAEEPGAALVTPPPAASRATAPPTMNSFARIAEAPPTSSSPPLSSAFAQRHYTPATTMSPSLPPLAAKPSIQQHHQHQRQYSTSNPSPPSASATMMAGGSLTGGAGGQHRYANIRPLPEPPGPNVEPNEPASKPRPHRRTNPSSPTTTSDPARVRRPIRTRRGGGKSKGKAAELQNGTDPSLPRQQEQHHYTEGRGQHELGGAPGTTRDNHSHYEASAMIVKDGYGANGSENEAGDEGEEGDLDADGDVGMTTTSSPSSFSRPTIKTTATKGGGPHGTGNRESGSRVADGGSRRDSAEEERKDSAAAMSTTSAHAAASPFGHAASSGYAAQFRDEHGKVVA